MKILLINGPNLNLQGIRQVDIYGQESFQSYFENLKLLYKNIHLEYFQSNIEGEIINKLHTEGFQVDGIIMNAGAYSHTSIAIRDAIAAIPAPVIEVHISNLLTRENFRHQSVIGAACKGCIMGFGLDSYRLAIEFFNGF